ncbi:MAG: hypothetical protein LBQ40_02605 [Clostridiales bacterium]|jgi:hypothetical protein|nr:hypothetical protein [Clostridiales bacterium]
MTKNEFKTVTKQWLNSKGFYKGKELEIEYLYQLSDFDISIYFSKDRFSEMFFFEIGFRLKDDSMGWGHVRVCVSNNIHGFYYEKWEKQDYIECLEEMYAVYIKPYFDLGIEMLKNIIAKPSFRGHDYLIHRQAIEKILKM